MSWISWIVHKLRMWILREEPVPNVTEATALDTDDAREVWSAQRKRVVNAWKESDHLEAHLEEQT